MAWAAEGDGELEDWERRAGEMVNRLAEHLRARTDDYIAPLIVNADAEAAAAGFNLPSPHAAPRGDPRSRLRRNRKVLLAAIEERGGAPDIVLPLLDRTVEMRRPGWESALARQLDSNQNMGAAISTALRLPCSEGLKRLAVRKSAQWLSLIKHRL